MNRRDFMKSSTFFVAGLAVSPFFKLPKAFAEDAPAAAGKPACTDEDPVANALGYKSVAKDIDVAKFKQFKPLKPEHNCKHCALYTAVPAAKGWGNCSMLANCSVKEGGLCGSWQKKSA